MERPYIGVTGVDNVPHGKAIVQAFLNEGLGIDQSTHMGMVGVLVSERSLRTQEGSTKYPNLAIIRNIFRTTRGKTFNTLHYHTYREKDLAGQLQRLLVDSYLFPDGLCDGIQLNIRWPDVEEIRKTRTQFPYLKIILQLGPRVLDASPESITSQLTPYTELINYALIDPSGGRNRLLAVNTAAPVHNQIRAAFPDLALAFAGGYNSTNVNTRLWLLFQTVGTKKFGIDAQGGLRSQSIEGESAPLSVNRARKYVHNATLFFQSNP